MQLKHAILFPIFALAACAVDQPQSTGPSLEERITQASTTITIIKPKAANWCEPAKSCTYVQELYCNSDSQKADKKCQAEISQKVIQAGGDTFVVQDAGIVKGFTNLYSDNYYRIYGQVYHCSDKFKDLYQEYATSHKQTTKSPVGFKSEDYFKQCADTKKCKSIGNQTCSTIRTVPFKLCNDKFIRNYHGRGGNFNQVVIKEELFNNAGSYRMFVDVYDCK